MELVQGVTPICEGSCRLTSLERQEVLNDCRSCKVKGLDFQNVMEEKNEREVSNNVSGAKRKLLRCGKESNGNEADLGTARKE
ncbi:hypothetical protein Tco_0735763 [Tanacetum coccineum]